MSEHGPEEGGSQCGRCAVELIGAERDQYRKVLEKIAHAVERADLWLVHGGRNAPGYKGGHSVFFKDEDWFDVQAAKDALDV